LFGCEPTPNAQQKQDAALTGIMIPAGPFIMGSNKTDKTGKQQEYGLVKPLFLDEHPQHRVELPAFYIDTYEVTNQQYKQFVRASNHAEPFEWTQNGYNLLPSRLKATDVKTLRWIASEYFKFDLDTNAMNKAQLLQAMFADWAKKDRLPVTGVDWHDASAYCAWAGKRLPTEAEWEKAARGPDGLEFPWGNQWSTEQTNIGDDTDWEGGIAPVGSYANNRSPYGVYDMAGNVWEWVEDWYQAYPGSDYQSKDFGTSQKVIRGGGGGVGHYSLSFFFRSAMRGNAEPSAKSADVGFRCAWDARPEADKATTP
jgi:formylglycine-generating enzyme required for sulfatase activity